MSQKMLCDSYRMTATSLGFNVEADEQHRVAGYTGRRTAAAVAARNGANGPEISEILGHAVNSVTFQRYLDAPHRSLHERRDILASSDG
jgi:integrase